MEQQDKFSRTINLVLHNGSRRAAELLVEAFLRDDQSEFYRITLSDVAQQAVGTSERGYFDALLDLRSKVEGWALLECFGASEDVYPSPMQFDMGPARLAYRMRIGHQALNADIVDIFDADDRVRPATIEQQELYRDRWFESLGSR